MSGQMAASNPVSGRSTTCAEVPTAAQQGGLALEAARAADHRLRQERRRHAHAPMAWAERFATRWSFLTGCAFHLALLGLGWWVAVYGAGLTRWEALRNLIPLVVMGFPVSFAFPIVLVRTVARRLSLRRARLLGVALEPAPRRVVLVRRNRAKGDREQKAVVR